MMKVTLLKPHTHAGVDYQIGDTLDMEPSTAAWLLEYEVIAPQPAAEPVKPASKPMPAQEADTKSEPAKGAKS